MHDEVPSWWRPYWAAVTIIIATFLMIEDDYGRLVPALVACGAACFTFEYLWNRPR